MDRRSFLVRVGAGMVVAPAVLTLKACGDDGPTPDSGLPDSGDEDSGDEDSTVPATSFIGVSSVSSGHDHTVTVECADLGADGVTYTSSMAFGHTHQVVITAEELGMIANGDEVVVMTSDAGHEHTWTIQKPETACA
jgi:hypothetical protein